MDIDQLKDWIRKELKRLEDADYRWKKFLNDNRSVGYEEALEEILILIEPTRGIDE